MKKRYILPVFLPFAGCANRCVYCDQEAITGQLPDKILQSAARQIDEWKERRKEWDEVAFYGGTFARLNKTVRLALYELAFPYAVRVSTCPESIDKEFTEEAKEHIAVLELGAQSLSDEVLKMNGRGYTADFVIEKFQRLKGAEIVTAAQFMTGLYGETVEHFTESCDRVKELRADFARIYPMLVLPGAPIAKMDFTPLSARESLLRSAWLFASLNACGIKVIRISLPQGFGAYCGFYHPAYGDLVKTIAVYANFLKSGALIDAFGGYKGVLRNLSDKRTAADFTEISQNILNSYNINEWLESAELKDFIEGLL
jgi:histone acetyltransferase (RNA polymerase elongator complex component)